MEERLEKIEQEIKTINERNKRVEADKAWETSLFRLFSVALITYLVATFLLYIVDTEQYLLGALVPAAGFILSVQTLPSLKRWWIERFFRK
ncbi:MAG: hypothetical protein UY50_C0010G0006 [Parcubacteria group bacterium GW2011_GWA2_49_9]|nr:MAG: hypothetical protein UY50_C0010G0006 [Parcubacteria group bacterium GW2011_GWA2_49_9]